MKALNYLKDYLEGEPLTGGFSFVPLDVPRFEVPEGVVTDFLRKNAFSSTILEKYPDHPTHKDIGGWKMQYSLRQVDLPGYYDKSKNPEAFVGDYPDTFKDSLNEELPWKWIDEAKHGLPQLISQIEKHLPFRKITDVTLVRNNDNLHPHMDQNYPAISFQTRSAWEQEHSPYEPLQYRIVFDGSIDNSTYVTESYDPDGKKVFLTMPKSTNTFALGATNCFHGATRGDVKTLVCVFGFLDLERQYDLICRSVRKYRDFCVQL